jgi:hypothetical protein
MGRNREKYDYAELAIPRDSVLYQALCSDAAASGQPLAQVALLRLADYYAYRQPEARLQSIAIRSAQGTPPATIPSAPARSDTTRQSTPFLSNVSPATPLIVSPAIETGEAQEEGEPELSADQASRNAAALLAHEGFF